MGIHNLKWKLQEALFDAEAATAIQLFKLDQANTPCLLSYGTTVPNAVAGYAKSGLFFDTDSAVTYINTGTAASCTFSALLTSLSQTLDGAFDGGKTIDGATSSANAVRIGDGTDDITLYRNAANDVRISTLDNASLTILTHGTGDLTLAPAGGDVTLTGTLTVSSTTTSTGNLIVGANKMVVTAASGNTTIAGTLDVTGALTVPSVTCAGNITGTFIGTWGGSTWNANPTITLTATTGTGLLVDGDTITSGDLLRLEGDASMVSGYFLRCLNVAAAKFSVGPDGSTIIAGTLAGTDALTVSAGDLKVTAGNIVVTLGNATLTDGNYVITEGKLTVDTATNEGSYIKRNQGTTTVPIFEIEATNVDDDYPCLYIDAKQTGAVDGMQIVYAGTASGLCITSSNVAGTALKVECVVSTTDSIVKVDGATNNWIGADAVGMVNLTCDGALAHANASLLNITYSGTGAASGLGTSIRVVDTGATNTSHAVYVSAATGSALYVAGAGAVDTITGTSAAAAASFLKVTMSAATGTALEVISAASSTVSQLGFTCAGTGATGWLGATNVGMVSIVGDGNLAHANASMLYVAYSGTGAATGLGTSLRIVDTGATNTSYAAYLSTGTAGALSIVCAGTAVDSIVVTSAATAKSGFKITTSVATGKAIEVISAASATVAAMSFANSGTGATGWLGATGVGMLTITGTGNLAHANASCLLIAYSGAGAATGLGTSLRITDTGSTATSYAAYISAATGEALFVDTGKAKFTEGATFKASNRNYLAPNYVTAGGGANAITATLTDADAANVTLAAGLEVYIDMAALTLQAGANTFNLNAGGAVSIKKSTAPTVDKAVISAANSIVHLIYNGTSWLDMSE